MSTYNLEEVKVLIRSNRHFITRTALATAASNFDFTSNDIIQCILNLQSSFFYKSMPADKCPTLYQDVYKAPISIKGKVRIAYIKIQIQENHKQERAVIISFKEA